MKRIPYWPLLFGPWGIFALGFFLNKVVMAFNGGQMPFISPGGCGAWKPDANHICMTAASHLRIFADWINMHSSMASPGDFLIDAGDYCLRPALAAWAALMIRECREFRAKHS